MRSPASTPCPSELDFRAFLDEQLEEGVRQLVVEHLENCEFCQGVCEALLPRLEPVEQPTVQGSSASETHFYSVVQTVKDRLLASQDAKSDRLSLDSTDHSALGSEFQLVRRLGQGAQGDVYLARDLSLDREVVIKFLASKRLESNESRERFKREFRSLACVRSPYVVPVFRVGELPSGKMYMVMEYVQGRTLRQLALTETMAIKRSVQIVKQIAEGLATIHQNKLVHRDIKPENILIDDHDGKVRIADFGLVFDCSAESRLTIDGTLIGTPAYMSPEQVLNLESVASLSDIYSLGVVLYELLTAQVPFRGTMRMTLLQVVHEEPISPRSFNEFIPNDLETICLRAMSKECSKRFQTASEFADELGRFLADQPILSRPVTTLERWLRKARKNPVVSSLIGTVVLLVLAATGLSIAYAVHLRAVTKRAEQNALVAKKQRDSALGTLADLVFQLQRKFDRDEVFIDEIQQSSLEIAKRGLEEVESIAGTTSEGSLAMAVALRRLGQSLFNLERLDESVRCYQKSEELLHQLLDREPHNAKVIMALADTVIAYDACTEDAVASTQLERFAFAAARFRDHDAHGDAEFIAKWATLLTSQARCQMQSQRIDEAMESLKMAEQALGTSTKDGDSQRQAFQRVALEVQWYFACAERLDHAVSAARRRAASLLERIEKLEADWEDDATRVQIQLGCYELLGCMSLTKPEIEEGEWRVKYESLKNLLRKRVETDRQELAVVSESIEMLAADRMNEGLVESAEKLLQLRMDLAEARLALLPNDEGALSVLLGSHVSMADVELERDTRLAYHRVLEHGLEACRIFEILRQQGSPDATDWIWLLEAVEAMFEASEATRAGGPQLEKIGEWCRKIVAWCDEAKDKGHDTGELLFELRGICAEFLNSGNVNR